VSAARAYQVPGDESTLRPPAARHPRGQRTPIAPAAPRRPAPWAGSRGPSRSAHRRRRDRIASRQQVESVGQLQLLPWPGEGVEDPPGLAVSSSAREANRQGRVCSCRCTQPAGTSNRGPSGRTVTSVPVQSHSRGAGSSALRPEIATRIAEATRAGRSGMRNLLLAVGESGTLILQGFPGMRGEARTTPGSTRRTHR